jgi:hypothetical protein
MAYSPISFISSNFRDYKNEWIKAYEPGTTTPKVMATDSTLGTLIAKAQLNADGFIVSAGAALIIPYIDGAYDLWLFPTEAEADANDTSNALRLADNVTGVSAEAIQLDLINDLSQTYDFDTVALMTASVITFPTSKVLTTKGYYAINDGGGASYTQTAGATPNIGSPAMSQGGYAELEILGEIIPKQWGAQTSAAGTTTGFDNSTITQAIYNYMTTNGVGLCSWGNGRYYFASNVNQPVVNDGLGTNPVYNVGTGINSTELFTDQNIDMFTHQDNFSMKSLSIAQRGTDGVTKYTGVALRANGQCRKCLFEDLDIWWFKFGTLQRFSLWNVYRKVTYNGNLCGIKLARSSDMEDQTNPSPVGVWNAADGWFHNTNSFDTIIFNGDKESNGGRGEIGFWGAIQGNAFRNITAQNYERDGTIPNQTIPIGQVSTGVEIVGGGPTSTNAKGNTITSFYIERTFKGLKVTDVDSLIIDQWFTQGQTGAENLLECDNSDITINGQVNQSAGWVADIVATDSNVTIDRPLQSNGGGGGRSLTNSYFSQTGVRIDPAINTSTVTMSAGTGGGTITIDTAADQLAYNRQGQEVTVTGRLDVLSVSALTGAFFNIDGLPFAPFNAIERAGNAAVTVSYFVIGGGAVTAQAGVILEGATSIRVYIDCTTIVAGDSVYVSATYLSDDFS